MKCAEACVPGCCAGTCLHIRDSIKIGTWSRERDVTCRMQALCCLACEYLHELVARLLRCNGRENTSQTALHRYFTAVCKNGMEILPKSAAQRCPASTLRDARSIVRCDDSDRQLSITE
jgi:hypothetical protein